MIEMLEGIVYSLVLMCAGGILLALAGIVLLVVALIGSLLMEVFF